MIECDYRIRMPFPELNKNNGFRQFRGIAVLLDIYIFGHHFLHPYSIPFFEYI